MWNCQTTRKLESIVKWPWKNALFKISVLYYSKPLWLSWGKVPWQYHPGQLNDLRKLEWYNREPVCLHGGLAYPSFGITLSSPFQKHAVNNPNVSYNKALFFFKMHILGNIVSDKFGIPPPSLQEYLYDSPRTNSLALTCVAHYVVIYNIRISINNSFKDNKAHNVQCISTWSSFNFPFPIIESLQMCISMASLQHQHASTSLWSLLMTQANFLTGIAWLCWLCYKVIL